MTEATAVVVAAGAGLRLGDPHGIPKTLRMLGDRAMYLHSLQAFDAHPGIERCVLVYPAIWEAQILEDLPGLVAGPVELIAGGATRQGSVLAGLGAAPSAEFVLIHDAARPFVTAALIDAVLGALNEADAVVPAIPVSDTLKRVSDDSVRETIDRRQVVQVQTPQAFSREVLLRAHERAARDGVEASDDAALVERIGVTVRVVHGDERNIKITTRGDLDLAQDLARARATR